MTPAPEHVRSDVWTALRECRLWRSAADAAITELARAARIEEVHRGARLIAEGEPAVEFAVVVAGRIRVFHLGADGKRIAFETLDAGDPVAVIAALAGGRHPANAEAVTPAILAWLASETLWELIAADDQVAREVISDLANRVVNFTGVVHTLALDVPSRLARYLFQRALGVGQPSSRGLEIDLGMSKTDLAEALGTVPETLSRAFARLRDEQLIEVQGGRVIILDVRAIARLGSGYSEG